MTHRKPILIVEDDPDIADSCRELLELEGYQVRVARTGDEALALLEGEMRPCLVLLDLHMPGLHGEALLDAVDERLPNRPPIVIATAQRLKVPPRHRVLHKPFDLNELLKIVRAHGCEAAAAAPAAL